jgi:hypothetical protein
MVLGAAASSATARSRTSPVSVKFGGLSMDSWGNANRIIDPIARANDHGDRRGAVT